MSKNATDQITLVSSQRAGRLIALGTFIVAVIALGYTLLPPDWVDVLENHVAGRSRWLFAPPFYVQKLIGLGLTAAFIGWGIRQWKKSANGRVIMTVDRSGVSADGALVPWDHIAEMTLLIEHYILVLNDGRIGVVEAADAAQKRDDVLEVVKRVKPREVRIEYIGKVPKIGYFTLPQLMPL